jgi:hypothetical protein
VCGARRDSPRVARRPSTLNVTVALQGNIPDLLTNRRDLSGAIAVTALKGSTPVEGATVVVYGAGTTTVIATKVTNPEGKATFSNVPVGLVDIRIFPPSGYTAQTPLLRDQPVPSGGTLSVTFTLQ